MADNTIIKFTKNQIQQPVENAEKKEESFFDGAFDFLDGLVDSFNSLPGKNDEGKNDDKNDNKPRSFEEKPFIDVDGSYNSD